MHRPLPLTIISAVLNEEKILPDFLAYATSIASEVIVVVDSRTTDTSARIAKEHGCRVIQDRGESEGIVFYNKNRGIDQASHEWVLILDADERLDEVFEKELADITAGNGDPNVTMYQTGFINIEFGKRFDKSDQKHKKFVRLFKKGAFRYHIEGTTEGFGIQTSAFGNSLLLKIPIVRSYFLSRKSNIENLNGYIIHNSHPTINDFLRKINRYSTREAHLLYKRNPTPSVVLLTIKLFLNPLIEFIYKYIIWKFYKEGAQGAIASILYSFYHFLIVAKYMQYSVISTQNSVGRNLKYDTKTDERDFSPEVNSGSK